MTEYTTQVKKRQKSVSAFPSIKINDRKLGEISDDALSALYKANEPPMLFVQSGGLVRFRTEKDGKPMLEPVNEAMLIGHLTRVADFYRSGEYRKIICDPPVKVARDILAIGTWKFPPISGIVEAPILRPDGSIVMKPGYDQKTGLYYCPAPDFNMEWVPDNPSKYQRTKAIELLREVFQDFPFKDTASLANMLALLITPLIRPAIDGCVPLALTNAPQAGTGKSMLGNIVALIATGRKPSMMPYSQESEEMRKKITSSLRENANVIMMDNITTEVNSEVLASALTTTSWGDRLLGKNEMLRLPQRATWIANGNNLQIGGDLPRRCFPIDLDAEASQPWKRTDFLHPDLEQWVTIRRSDLLWSIFTLVRAWISAGKPMFDRVQLGGFSQWAQVIGGILAIAGIPNFLANLESMYETADIEGSQWESFLLALQEVFHQNWFTTAQVSEAMLDNPALVDTLPDELGSPFRYDGGLDHRFKQKIGMELRQRIHTRYGLRQMFIDHEKDPHLKVAKWRVLCGDAGTRGTSSTNIKNPIESISNTLDKAPASPASPAGFDMCRACGQSNWAFYKDGSGRFCATCHPVLENTGGAL